MNSENFHEYVKNPSMLHQVSYQELKSLVLQYPYSPNLRYLLLLKSLFDQTKDYDRNLTLASLSSPDRKKLRQLVKQYTRLRKLQENYALNEDFLELKDLSSLENLMQAMDEAEQAAPAGGVSKAEQIATPQPSNSVPEKAINDENDLSFLEDMPETDEPHEAVPDVPAPAASNLASQTSEPDLPEPIAEAETELTLEDILENEALEPAGLAEFEPEIVEPDAAEPVELETAEEINLEIENAEPAAPEIAEQQPTAPQTARGIPLEITNQSEEPAQPLPKSSFNSWLRQFNPPQVGVLAADLKDISLNNRPQHPTEQEEGDDAKHIADQSVEEDEEIVSETLAVLLEKQKLFGKAISMYKRLSLQYPEKSSLFAAKIEELSKKK